MVALEESLAHYHGDFLAGFYVNEWETAVKLTANVKAHPIITEHVQPAGTTAMEPVSR